MSRPSPSVTAARDLLSLPRGGSSCPILRLTLSLRWTKVFCQSLGFINLFWVSLRLLILMLLRVLRFVLVLAGLRRVRRLQLIFSVWKRREGLIDGSLR